MGEKNIKKEVKKPKKSDKKSSTPDFAVERPVVVQPTLIKKEKKTK
ncbi:MAG: hypothetical protein RR315_00845 [Oscillospiraceae bacterium]